MGINAGSKARVYAVTEATRDDGEYVTTVKKLFIGNGNIADSEFYKPLNPHHFRHSRATFLATKFKEAQLCGWFGWVQGSTVPGEYVPLSGRVRNSS